MNTHNFVFEDIHVEYLEGGTGFPILMIHGSGPGASTLGNWSKVLGPLSDRYHIHAMDLIGFGKSGRKPAPPYFDFPLWLAQCRELISRMPGEQIGIIGHSISGSLALKLAHADKRIVKVMTTATVGANSVVNAATDAAWSFPADRDMLRAAAELFIYDKSLIDDAYLSAREKVLFSGDYKEYFSKMFEGDKHQYLDQARLSSEELHNVTCDVMMVHGRDDTSFPAEFLTLPISRMIPHADVVLLGRCSHSVAFEHPQKFLALAQGFFG